MMKGLSKRTVFYVSLESSAKGAVIRRAEGLKKITAFKQLL